ncbi:hypothetical protein GCM10023185_42060 [Hymenobacter saemangeumensis]|uniref:Uncharacterized protein n=1 Tax=Hymenobacter saemangeumensis TaxID=1084522 RepID=A0ABP8ISD8_9BACT
MSDTLQLLIEQSAHDEAEAAQLTRLTELVATAAQLPGLRDLAPAVRHHFPEPTYLVGCGSAHIWLHRAGDAHRLALIR